MQDLRQTEGWTRYLTSQGWIVENLKSGKAYLRKIPGVGTVIKIQRPKATPSATEIDQLAQKHRAIFVKLEPLTPGPKPGFGFTPDQNPNLATKTIRLDLKKDRSALWQDLAKDARQSLRKTVKNNLRLTKFTGESKELNQKMTQFHALLAESGKRGRFGATHLRELQTKAKAFGPDALLLLVGSTNQPQPLAGALIFLCGDTAYFHHLGSSGQGQKLFAPYFLVWEVIKLLKNKAGIKSNPRYLDLEGIYDPRYHKATRKWQGFTIFKRKWGGEEVSFPQPLIKHYRLWSKLLFKLGEIN